MAEPPDHANVVVIPPLLLALCVGAAWLADRLAPAPFLPKGPELVWSGGALVALGAAVEGWAFLTIRAARTSVLPIRPTRAIVETGPYRFSRNPIYLGMTSSILGCAVGLDSLWQFAGLALFLFVIRWGVIAREEAYLMRKFGAAYADYAARVRRWL